MTADNFDEATRGLGTARTRRAAIFAVLGAAAAALQPAESEGRRFSNPRRTRKNRTGKGRKDSRRAGRDKDRGQSKDRKRKKKNGSGGGCSSNYSEKEILGFIKKAANKYGQSAKAMERVARCESVLDPCAVNRSGPYYGLFQFLKSTWRDTPYGNRSIWDPEAQSLATAWMWKEGRKNEWACK